MEGHIPTRQEAMDLLREFNKTDKAIKHSLAVEATMRYMAAKSGQDAEAWGVVGLIHDLDYEQFPTEHCKKTVELLTQRGWPAELIRAAASHGWPTCTDIEPLSPMEKTLYAIDELTGLVAACALVRPSKSVMDLEAKSVKKKWKEKQFAAGVDRAVIEKGAAMLGVELSALINDVILAMREQAAALGLAGQAQP
jgi:putative nucleotidyltransferase with HDIG domain